MAAREVKMSFTTVEDDVTVVVTISVKAARIIGAGTAVRSSDTGIVPMFATVDGEPATPPGCDCSCCRHATEALFRAIHPDAVENAVDALVDRELREAEGR